MGKGVANDGTLPKHLIDRYKLVVNSHPHHHITNQKSNYNDNIHMTILTQFPIYNRIIDLHSDIRMVF